jgi:hypothetical protein
MRRYCVIACQVFYREFCRLAAEAAVVVDLDFMPQGLHDIESADMARRIQDSVDAADGRGYDAVLLGYALCNNGIVGVEARSCPLIVPRAHDCITLFLGSRERYGRMFEGKPGTYYLTTGWIERDDSGPDGAGQPKMSTMGLDRAPEEYIREYGAENARYIMETIQGGLHYYTDLVYIDMGEGDLFGHVSRARDRADERGWAFKHVPGSWELLSSLVSGAWDAARFLTVPPGHRIVARYDDGIIDAAPSD